MVNTASEKRRYIRSDSLKVTLNLMVKMVRMKI